MSLSSLCLPLAERDRLVGNCLPTVFYLREGESYQFIERSTPYTLIPYAKGKLITPSREASKYSKASQCRVASDIIGLFAFCGHVSPKIL